MKGPKIENLRDPKWLGKQIMKSYCLGAKSEWRKVLHQGIDKFFYVNNIGNESSDCYDAKEYESDFDWYEWIEEEKKTKFPFKVGDKIRRKDWNNKNNYVKIQLIIFSIHENERKIYVEKHFSNTATSYDIYFITDTDWELYVEDKPHQDKAQEEPEFPYKVGDTIRHKSWIERNSYLEILAIKGPFEDYYKDKYFEIDGVLDRDVIVPITKKTSHYAPRIVNTTYRIATTDYKDWELYWEL